MPSKALSFQHPSLILSHSPILCPSQSTSKVKEVSKEFQDLRGLKAFRVTPLPHCLLAGLLMNPWAKAYQ